MTSLETSLRSLRDGGRKAFVPYFMAGASKDWLRHVEAAAHAGADAIEIGLPFSDPMIDGVVIQEAALRSLERGTSIDSVVSELDDLEVDVPLIAMTYYNVVLHGGLERSASLLRGARVSGVIIPDLPLEEALEWEGACAQHDLATIFLVAPSTPPTRLEMIAQRTKGFCYAQGRMAVTGTPGARSEGGAIATAVRAVTDVPVYVGIGISTPAQASDAASQADGAIVGTAMVELLLRGASVGDVESFVASFRHALDHAPATDFA
ncbi:MAG TPA: tryptophan synthase subunit alpha [Acidimicrobiales bacterium]|nr:MAG: tryptophan synthase subunit alpha [Actinobacteria bacterium 21-64-8]HQT99643.1 tryptophan synthase subunit alpha [Acidimicrobiales bacterium]